ncbi:hypothetical protein D3C75_875620 [compost metagenome]
MEGSRVHEQSFRIHFAVVHILREHKAFWNLSEIIELRTGQPSLHVPEAVLVRNKPDISFLAVGVKLQNFLPGYRGFKLPDLGKGFIGKGRTFYI